MRFSLELSGTGAPPTPVPQLECYNFRMTQPIGPVAAVLFDLDGVLVTTDALHARAWKAMADREGVPFDDALADRLRGVGRMDALAIILDEAGKACTAAEREAMATWKNERYKAMLAELTPSDVLPGSRELLAALRTRGIKAAVASSSKNARAILDRLELTPMLDAVADGSDVPKTKPDPAVFVLAAQKLGVAPSRCVVVEDAAAGVQAALAAGMRVLGVGDAERVRGCHAYAHSLAEVSVERVVAL